MHTDALLDCYSLNSDSTLHASSPRRETALKDLEASENGFRENLVTMARLSVSAFTSQD